MTEQWETAMLELYKRESMCSDHVKKAVIDEALDQLMRWQDSKQEPAWLVRNALSNAQKKVYRYGQRMAGPVDEACLEGPCGELGLVETLDALCQVKLTRMQRIAVSRSAQGYEVQEIARECGVSDKAVYRNRQMGRAALRAYVDMGYLGKVG